MIGFAHEVEIEAEGRQEEPQEEKMPKGRTDRPAGMVMEILMWY